MCTFGYRAPVMDERPPRRDKEPRPSARLVSAEPPARLEEAEAVTPVHRPLGRR
jgi:hypothetical protein